MTRLPWRQLVAAATGGAVGFAYYHFIGCHST